MKIQKYGENIKKTAGLSSGKKMPLPVGKLSAVN